MLTMAQVAGWVRRHFWPRESFLDLSNGTTSAGKPIVLNRSGLVDQTMLSGTVLAEYIADTAGAMVTGNTETGITVTYQDADNTIDFDAQTAGDARYAQLAAANTFTVGPQTITDTVRISAAVAPAVLETVVTDTTNNETKLHIRAITGGGNVFGSFLFGRGANVNEGFAAFTARTAAVGEVEMLRAELGVVKIYRVLRAIDGSGLRLEDDAGNLGVFVQDGGLVAIGPTAPTAQAHIDQSSTTAAIPVLILDQADLDQPMIEFVTTIGTGNAVEAVGAKVLTTTHFVMVKLPGGLTRYFPVGTIASFMLTYVCFQDFLRMILLTVV